MTVGLYWLHGARSYVQHYSAIHLVVSLLPFFSGSILRKFRNLQISPLLCLIYVGTIVLWVTGNRIKCFFLRIFKFSPIPVFRHWVTVHFIAGSGYRIFHPLSIFATVLQEADFIVFPVIFAIDLLHLDNFPPASFIHIRDGLHYRNPDFIGNFLVCALYDA